MKIEGGREEGMEDYMDEWKEAGQRTREVEFEAFAIDGLNTDALLKLLRVAFKHQ